MVGIQVEFVDDAGASEPPRNRAPRLVGARPVSLALAEPALWIAAAVLSVFATFQTIFTYRFTGDSITSRGGYDAWGHALDAQLNTDHGPRYAVLLWLCATLFALLAAALLGGGFSAGRAGRWTQARAGAIGLAVVGLLAGVLAGVALGVESSFSVYRGLAKTLNDTHGGVELLIGGCIWFGLASLACALGAVLVHAWSGKRTHLREREDRYSQATGEG